MEFRFLGPFDVVDDQRIVPIVGGKQRALLAILALHANEVVPVGRLIDDLWPDEPPDSALNSIQAYVSRLRKALSGNGTGSGAETIVFRHGGYMLDVSAEQIDARRFARLVEDGERRIDAGEATVAADVLREALGLWRGPALSDFAHERFAQPEIARLEELRLKAVEDRIDADLASGRDAALVPELEALIAEHPLRERLRRQLMLALYRCGRQGDALTVYRETRATLDAELGVEPTPELRELELAILRQDEALGPVHRPRTSLASVRARRWLWVTGVAVVAAVAILAVAVLQRPDGGSPAAVRVVSNSVAVLDAATIQIVDDVIVGDYPGPIAAGNGSVWVGNIGANTMTEIDASTHDAEFPAGVQRPLDIAVTSDAVWVANSSDFEMTPPAGGGTVERRGVRFGALTTAQVGTPGITDDGLTFVATDGHSVWAANGLSRTIVRLDPRTARVVERVRGVGGGGIAVVDGSVWVAEPDRNTVARVDQRTGDVVARIPVSGNPRRVAVGEGAVWVTTTGSHSALWRIDPRSNETVAVIPVPPRARRVATGAGYVWVTSGRSDEEQARRRGMLSKIDPRTDQIVGSVRLGFRPDGVVVANGLVWVAIAPV